MASSINIYSSYSSSQFILTGLSALALIKGANANSGSFGESNQDEEAGTTTAVAETAHAAATAATVAAAESLAGNSETTPLVAPTTTAVTGKTKTAATSAAIETANSQLVNSEAVTAQNKKSATGSAGASATTGVSYNQYGFTGSQSVWEAATTSGATTALTSTTTGSLTSHHSLVASVLGNSTSNANKLQLVGFERDNSWKNVMLVGGILGVSALLQAL